jgi:RNA polymerase sigma-70 factor (ECF subfamily)
MLARGVLELTMNAVEQFETYRPLLFSIAYRMLGSVMEAEDMVQETFLRYQITPLESIHSPKAFLSTVITRLCLNQLDTARVKREAYIGPWLPEPLSTAEDPQLSPSDEVEMRESISVAFLVLLETLTPVERAVFLLRQVFEYEYAEIAEMVGKDQAACRQLFSRAKKHIAERRPRFKPTPEQHRQVLDRFVHAVTDGDVDGLNRMLADDVTMWADGGGKIKGAATHPLHGREAVARFLMASTRLVVGGYRAEAAELNGEPSVILRSGDKAFLVLFIALEQDQVQEIRVIGNPDKLQRL